MTDTEVVKTEKKTICIPDLSIDSLKESNKAVAKLSQDHDESLSKIDELTKEIDSLKAENKVLNGYKEQIEKQIQKETDALRTKVKELKVFDDEEITKMGTDELNRILKAAKVEVTTTVAPLNIASDTRNKDPQPKLTVGRCDWRTGKWTGAEVD